MSDLITSTHAETTRIPTHKLIAALNENLGTTLVAFMANVRSRQLPRRWASDPDDEIHTEPRVEALQRLQLAYQAFRVIEELDSEHVARQWLIGANPRLSGQTPAERIREFDGAAVYGALQAFVDDEGGA